MANPCLFNHEDHNIQVVVHGDDFTFLGTDDRLDWITSELKKVFEIKVRGRLGVGCADSEIKILNRIVRIDERGLRYEADPRHCDLLIPSLGLQNGSSVKTPGVKPADPELEAPKGEEGEINGQVIDSQGNVFYSNAQGTDTSVTGPLSPSGLTPSQGIKKAAVKSLSEIMDDKAYDKKEIAIMLEPEVIHEVPAYSEIYGLHPRLLMSTPYGMVRVPSNMDPYTSKCADVMRNRRARHHMCNGEKVRAHDEQMHKRPGKKNMFVDDNGVLSHFSPLRRAPPHFFPSHSPAKRIFSNCRRWRSSLTARPALRQRAQQERALKL
mgnify:CR=1 FL=1